jgi:hypothetical protein
MSTARFLKSIGCAVLLATFSYGVASAQSVTAIAATTKALELSFPAAKPAAEGAVTALTATTKALELAFAAPKAAPEGAVTAVTATTTALQLAFPTPAPVKK